MSKAYYTPVYIWSAVKNEEIHDDVSSHLRNTFKCIFIMQNQYIFVHDIILEFLTCGNTQIALENIHVAISELTEEDPTHQCTGYQHQFNVLNQVSPNPTEVNCSTALKHPDKNRGDKYLPGKKECPTLFSIMHL